MTKKTKAPQRAYQPQENHTAENCHINDAPHNHPDMDCGHYVASGPGYQQDEDNKYGPGTGVPAPGNAGSPKHDNDQDPEHGPGVK